MIWSLLSYGRWPLIERRVAKELLSANNSVEKNTMISNIAKIRVSKINLQHSRVSSTALVWIVNEKICINANACINSRVYLFQEHSKGTLGNRILPTDRNTQIKRCIVVCSNIVEENECSLLYLVSYEILENM